MICQIRRTRPRAALAFTHATDEGGETMQKTSWTLLAAFTMLAQGSVHAQTAPASLCLAQEQVIFSCSVKPSKKLVSLCAQSAA